VVRREQQKIYSAPAIFQRPHRPNISLASVEMKSICCYLLVLLAMAQVTVAQSAVEGNVSASERAFTASRIYSMLGLYFSGWKSLPELDLDIAYRNYLDKALAADDRRRFDLETIEFVARLHNGHTIFWDPWLTKNYGQPMGFYVRPLDEKWVVQSSVVPNINAGDIVAKIDDTPVETFFRQQEKYIAGSNEAAQRRNLFSLPYLFPEQFTLTLQDGHSIRVDRTVNRPTAAAPKVEGHWLTQSTTGYIRISSFAEPAFEERAAAYVVQFEKARAVIIDVRNNAGGLIPRNLLKTLMDRPYRNWKQSTPIHISAPELSNKINRGKQQKDMTDFERGYLSASAAFFGGSDLEWGGDMVPPNSAIFHGRLIFLVDGGCASACEDLVGPFKQNHRGTLVGETTQGSSGPMFEQDLGNGMKLGIAATRQYFPDDTEFEGVGIKPDLEVQPSVSDLQHGRDAVLEKALELASQP
jgi:carboxyl-terminal processing protease